MGVSWSTDLPQAGCIQSSVGICMYILFPIAGPVLIFFFPLARTHASLLGDMLLFGLVLVFACS